MNKIQREELRERLLDSLDNNGHFSDMIVDIVDEWFDDIFERVHEVIIHCDGETWSELRFTDKSPVRGNIYGVRI